MPYESTIYVGDHAYLPYGEKSKLQIRKRAKKLITFLFTKNVKLIVVACNTATIAGIDQYRIWFPDIPIIGVVPVIKTAAQVSKKNSFAVLSTVFTANSTYQKQLIKKLAPATRVYNLGCPNLLSFVEKGVVRSKEIDAELKSLLTPEVLDSIDVIALGCTHYPFLRGAIRAIVGKDIQILDSGGAVARHVERILKHNEIMNLDGHATHEFYSTGKDKQLSWVASSLLGRPLAVRYAHV